MRFWEKTVDKLFLENEVFRFNEGGRRGRGLFGDKRKICEYFGKARNGVGRNKEEVNQSGWSFGAFFTCFWE